MRIRILCGTGRVTVPLGKGPDKIPDVVLVNLCRGPAKRRVCMSCNSAARVPHTSLSGKRANFAGPARKSAWAQDAFQPGARSNADLSFARQCVSSNELDSYLLSMTYTILARYGVSSKLPPTRGRRNAEERSFDSAAATLTGSRNRSAQDDNVQQQQRQPQRQRHQHRTESSTSHTWPCYKHGDHTNESAARTSQNKPSHMVFSGRNPGWRSCLCCMARAWTLFVTSVYKTPEADASK